MLASHLSSSSLYSVSRFRSAATSILIPKQQQPGQRLRGARSGVAAEAERKAILSLGGGLRASMADDDEDYSLTCPICLELLTNPVMLPCCQQTYCKRCLRQALSNSGKCPLCRAPAGMELSLPNRALEGLLALRKGRDIESAIPHWPAQRRRNAFLPERVRA